MHISGIVFLRIAPADNVCEFPVTRIMFAHFRLCEFAVTHIAGYANHDDAHFRLRESCLRISGYGMMRISGYANNDCFREWWWCAFPVAQIMFVHFRHRIFVHCSKAYFDIAPAFSTWNHLESSWMCPRRVRQNRFVNHRSHHCIKCQWFIGQSFTADVGRNVASSCQRRYWVMFRILFEHLGLYSVDSGCTVLLMDFMLRGETNMISCVWRQCVQYPWKLFGVGLDTFISNSVGCFVIVWRHVMFG